MEQLEQVIFYTLDKAIKSYRQFAQKNITAQKFDLTIDQWLVLTTLVNNPDVTQQQIAEMVFKDYASVTRIIELMVKKEILNRNFHPDDRRRFDLSITERGKRLLSGMNPIIHQNRTIALEGLSKEEIETLRRILQKITVNCQTRMEQ